VKKKYSVGRNEMFKVDKGHDSTDEGKTEHIKQKTIK
jgi:hypothetical protein